MIKFNSIGMMENVPVIAIDDSVVEWIKRVCGAVLCREFSEE